MSQTLAAVAYGAVVPKYRLHPCNISFAGSHVFCVINLIVAPRFADACGVASCGAFRAVKRTWIFGRCDALTHGLFTSLLFNGESVRLLKGTGCAYAQSPG